MLKSTLSPKQGDRVIRKVCLSQIPNSINLIKSYLPPGMTWATVDICPRAEGSFTGNLYYYCFLEGEEEEEVRPHRFCP